MKYIDTHAHLNLSNLSDDALTVAKKCADEEVVVINVGTNAYTSTQSVALTEETDNCYAIIGLHPTQAIPGARDGDDVSSTGTAEVFDTDF